MKTKISVTTINGCRGLPAIAAVQITKVIKIRLAGLENIIFMDGDPSTVFKTCKRNSVSDFSKLWAKRFQSTITELDLCGSFHRKLCLNYKETP